MKICHRVGGNYGNQELGIRRRAAIHRVLDQRKVRTIGGTEMGGLRGWLERGLRVFLEMPCPLCGRLSEQALCNSCQRRVRVASLVPAWDVLDTLPILAWGGYGGGLKQAIAALKYDQHPHLANLFGEWMGQTWNRVHSGFEGAIVVPIPLHSSKQRERGFNQAALLARSFCQVTNLPLQEQGLQRQRATTAQFQLSPSERKQNLQDAFCLGRALNHQHPAQPILLLDDIYTTGATAQAAASVLRSRGFEVKGIVVLAKAVKEV